MVNRERLVNTFLELVRIDSPSGKEREVADYIHQALLDLGIDSREDLAGNIIAHLASSKEPGTSLLVAAHMDTVVSSAGIHPIIEQDIIKTDGRTILGADDKAGIAVILEALRTVKEKNEPHVNITLIFTVAEELGMLGACYLDEFVVETARQKQTLGYVLDSGGPVGTVIVKAPSEVDFKITIKGKKAHAGVSPEDGINAIAVAGKVLTRLQMGRLDEETTANIGIIRGGEMTNIVPGDVVMEGEVRSHNEEKITIYLSRLEQVLAEETNKAGAGYALDKKEIYQGFTLGAEAPVIKRVSNVSRRLGIKVALQPRGGGSDANILNARGIPTVNLGIGMTNDHTNEEYIRQEDLLNATQLLVELFKDAE